MFRIPQGCCQTFVTKTGLDRSTCAEYHSPAAGDKIIWINCIAGARHLQEAHWLRGVGVCGICGVAHSDSQKPVDRGVLERMRDALVHRGPDDAGLHVDGAVGLGSRRLSIIDLPGGRQPLANEDRSVWIVFNGEIYNYIELRSEEHTSELQSRLHLVCRLLLEKKKKIKQQKTYYHHTKSTTST